LEVWSVHQESKSELIWGAQAIAAEIGRSERQVFHMLATGALPATKVGNQWVIPRAKLWARLNGEAA
jgi:hypothetical protein